MTFRIAVESDISCTAPDCARCHHHHGAISVDGLERLRRPHHLAVRGHRTNTSGDDHVDALRSRGHPDRRPRRPLVRRDRPDLGTARQRGPRARGRRRDAAVDPGHHRSRAVPRQRGESLRRGVGAIYETHESSSSSTAAQAPTAPMPSGLGCGRITEITPTTDVAGVPCQLRARPSCLARRVERVGPYRNWYSGRACLRRRTQLRD